MHSVTFSMHTLWKTEPRLHPTAYLCPTSKLEASGVLGCAAGPLSQPLAPDCVPHPHSRPMLQQEVVQYCGFFVFFFLVQTQHLHLRTLGFLQALVNFHVTNCIWGHRTVSSFESSRQYSTISSLKQSTSVLPSLSSPIPSRPSAEGPLCQPGPAQCFVLLKGNFSFPCCLIVADAVV